MTPSVMVRSISDIEDILKNNPFEGKFDNDKEVHVFFLNEKLSKEKTELLLSNNTKNEKLAVRGREHALDAPGGSSDAVSRHWSPPAAAARRDPSRDR